MKPATQREASRWLSQATHAVEVAKTLLDNACYAETCFHAEQAGQVALKAFLYGQGERYVHIHSVKALMEQGARYEPAFQQFTDAGKVLDQ